MGTINFNDNLEHALIQLYQQKRIANSCNTFFKILIDKEEKLKMKSKDLLYFPFPRAKNKLLRKEEVVEILSGPRCTFPLWIDMSLAEYDEKIIVQLNCSCRFRKSSELHNQDTGFPPFRVL